ncbi:MAG: GH39 family glycosyl hydrolase, partial [Planctomycetota bacterium]
MSCRIQLFISIILVLFGPLGLQADDSNSSEVVMIGVEPNAKQLMSTLADINPEHVYLRQHFLLASGDGKPSLKWSSSNVYTEDSAGNPVYDWRIMDEMMDAIVASGCRPLIEIGFMPKDLAVKPEPYKSSDPFKMTGYGVYFPPKDYEKWAELIRRWARHSARRYKGVEKGWLWELWNEP